MTMARESRDPNNDDSLIGTFRVVLRKFLQGTDDMLPAMVQEYDRKKNLARVQPLIQLIDTEGQPQNRAPVANIPVLLIGGGTFFLSFNLPPGSLGWIKANDRDISLFLQNFVNDRPNTNRMHTFSDAVFIPDIMTGYTIAGEDSDAAVLQNQTGTVRMSLSASRIKMSAPRVEINTPDAEVIGEKTTISSAATEISGTLTVSGASALNSGVTVTGASALNGLTTVTGGMSVDGTEFGSHTHPQGPDSDGNIEQDTGSPQ